MDGETGRATEKENERLETAGSQVCSLATTGMETGTLGSPSAGKPNKVNRKAKRWKKSVLNIKRKTKSHLQSGAIF